MQAASRTHRERKIKIKKLFFLSQIQTFPVDFKLNLMASQCGRREKVQQKLFNIARKTCFQMAFCGEKLAHLIAASRFGGHFPSLLGNLFVFVPGTCLRQLHRNANNLSCYRSTSLRNISELCGFAR